MGPRPRAPPGPGHRPTTGPGQPRRGRAGPRRCRRWGAAPRLRRRRHHAPPGEERGGGGGGGGHGCVNFQNLNCLRPALCPNILGQGQERPHDGRHWRFFFFIRCFTLKTGRQSGPTRRTAQKQAGWLKLYAETATASSSPSSPASPRRLLQPAASAQMKRRRRRRRRRRERRRAGPAWRSIETNTEKRMSEFNVVGIKISAAT